MYAQAPFGHNNMAAAVPCSFHHHHRIMFHLFHYSTYPQRYNIIDTNEHSIEQWKRGFIYYEVRIFNCWNEISGDELVVSMSRYFVQGITSAPSRCAEGWNSACPVCSQECFFGQLLWLNTSCLMFTMYRFLWGKWDASPGRMDSEFSASFQILMRQGRRTRT